MSGDPDAERARLKRLWPDEYGDGARSAFLQRYDGKRERGGYPPGFHGWPLASRNAWFAGFNVGLHDRLRLALENAGGKA